jgi:NADPH:quinone reductase-like Zn-dependent oxidoreductase
VITRGGGGPEVLEAQEVEDPAPLGDGEVLLQVVAAGVNRADTLQRHGRHPPPAGAPPYPGLECSGTILALGPNAPPRWAVGDKVEWIRCPPASCGRPTEISCCCRRTAGLRAA